MIYEKYVIYWINLAFEDIDVAKGMFSLHKYLYCGFMCHLCIEKALKALYVQQNEKESPYTHNLILLAKGSNIYETLSEQNKFLLAKLMPLNIEARYPKIKNNINKTTTKEFCTQLLKETEELLIWVKAQLEIN